MTSIQRAAQLILNTDYTDKGYINLIDATATFPQNRWESILKLLIKKNHGAPHEMMAYARSVIGNALRLRTLKL